MRLAFDAQKINERGTSVAIFDYAFQAREILGLEPIVLFDRACEKDNAALARFRRYFECLPYEDRAGFQKHVDERKADIAYFLKAGDDDGRLSRSSKNIVHVVFKHCEPHGEVYAYISSWLTRHVTGGVFPFVPHMVSLPHPDGTLRASLGIPQNAFVVGRHGGYEQFNLPFVRRALLDALGRRRDLHAIFLNTQPFCRHERVFFLPAVTDPREKANFIASCDAGLHGRKMGESFGLAIAEFLSFDKPVIAWAGGTYQNHIAMMPDPRFLYRTAGDLVRILCDFEPVDGHGLWRSATESFLPAAVMADFDRVFIKGESTEGRTVGLPHRLRRLVAHRTQRTKDRLWMHGLRVYA